ncbi:MAG: hypothetical protein R3F04_07175 [Lysobacteraceae bacterium]
MNKSKYKKLVRIELAKADLARSNQYQVASSVGLFSLLSVLLLISARWSDSDPGRWYEAFGFASTAVIVIMALFWFFAWRTKMRAISELQRLFDEDKEEAPKMDQQSTNAVSPE